MLDRKSIPSETRQDLKRPSKKDDDLNRELKKLCEVEKGLSKGGATNTSRTYKLK